MFRIWMTITTVASNIPHEAWVRDSSGDVIEFADEEAAKTCVRALEAMTHSRGAVSFRYEVSAYRRRT